MFVIASGGHRVYNFSCINRVHLILTRLGHFNNPSLPKPLRYILRLSYNSDCDCFLSKVSPEIRHYGAFSASVPRTIHDMFPRSSLDHRSSSLELQSIAKHTSEMAKKRKKSIRLQCTSLKWYVLTDTIEVFINQSAVIETQQSPSFQ